MGKIEERFQSIGSRSEIKYTIHVKEKGFRLILSIRTFKSNHALVVKSMVTGLS